MTEHEHCWHSVSGMIGVAANDVRVSSATMRCCHCGESKTFRTEAKIEPPKAHGPYA